ALIGYVGAASTKSVMLGVLILLTARVFVPYGIAHPAWMVTFLILTAVSFSLLGFIIGLWADNFEQLQVVPLMIVKPLTFLAGAAHPRGVLQIGSSVRCRLLWRAPGGQREAQRT